MPANRYFIVIFSSMADRERVFSNSPHVFGTARIILKPWNLEFNARKELSNVLHVWVHLFCLPLEFW